MVLGSDQGFWSAPEKWTTEDTEGTEKGTPGIDGRRHESSRSRASCHELVDMLGVDDNTAGWLNLKAVNHVCCGCLRESLDEP